MFCQREHRHYRSVQRVTGPGKNPLQFESGCSTKTAITTIVLGTEHKYEITFNEIFIKTTFVHRGLKLKFLILKNQVNRNYG